MVAPVTSAVIAGTNPGSNLNSSYCRVTILIQDPYGDKIRDKRDGSVEVQLRWYEVDMRWLQEDSMVLVFKYIHTAQRCCAVVVNGSKSLTSFWCYILIPVI